MVAPLAEAAAAAVLHVANRREEKKYHSEREKTVVVSSTQLGVSDDGLATDTHRPSLFFFF
jgi:hypothetical protein